jgi:hypothetical protein
VAFEGLETEVEPFIAARQARHREQCVALLKSDQRLPPADAAEVAEAAVPTGQGANRNETPP